MVAEAANVSRVAVSRAFNPAASIKPEKRARILRVAQELSYAPNMAGRALATRRSHLIGVIVPDVCSPWESQEIDALTTALQNEGFATLLFKTRTDRSVDARLLSYMGAHDPDSLVVFTENVRPDQLMRAFNRAVPIYVDYPDDADRSALSFDGGGAPFDRLCVLQANGIDQAVALMAGNGRRRFAVLSGSPNTSANAARLNVFSRILVARGLPPAVQMSGDFSYETGRSATLSLFRVGEGADAIFAANDVSAFGVIDALRFDMALRVPEDVNVVGFDDIRQASWRSYDLTTVRIDVDERVAALVRLILARIKNPDVPSLVETIQTRLVVRGTVG
jgi:DNA-binding LacI/PurR family transcriptional regulator